MQGRYRLVTQAATVTKPGDGGSCSDILVFRCCTRSEGLNRTRAAVLQLPTDRLELTGPQVDRWRGPGSRGQESSA